MTVPAPEGFTLVEVILAVMLLGMGVMALVGSSAMVTRMIGRGQQYTAVSQRARDRFEWLRQVAASTSVACTAAGFSSGSASADGITERWTVPPAGTERRIVVSLSYRTALGPRADTVAASLLCP